MGLSFWHLAVVVLVIVLLFGTKRLPHVMEDLAKGIRSFKKGLKEDETKAIDKKDDQRNG